MKIKFTTKFKFLLEKQLRYISRDKPVAAKKFKNDLLFNLTKDLQYPFYYKKSIYFENENIRDYVFKGYTIVYFIDTEAGFVSVFGFIKYKDSL
ncbi:MULTISPECIES: type II toxin-antitoxin system RelE/ParE family toxin [Flavobacterium]|uniref:type II toxin-antitoxin system RelE/ParE family toxin n=1 Tax=Flavobacterium TaxID=237 RepID=UPI00188A1565|nr:MULTISPECIES: type II toxin-antitoxin system RelE/ParE family toxin [Flavobacterium]MBF4472487.1 type II toxin-antitoxin system RelE/ParE family toxin [Flavobacterium sp. HJJ]